MIRVSGLGFRVSGLSSGHSPILSSSSHTFSESFFLWVKRTIILKSVNV